MTYKKTASVLKPVRFFSGAGQALLTRRIRINYNKIRYIAETFPNVSKNQKYKCAYPMYNKAVNRICKKKGATKP